MPRRITPVPQTPFVPGEVDDLPFRFGREMRADEAIVQTTVDCVSVGAAPDPDPMARLPVPEQVDGTTVVQRFAASSANLRYVLTCEARLSSGRILIGAMLIPVIPVHGS